ncbi:MAG TPA: hypothetical protein VNZ58_08460 [Thermomicrobiales bacterium]|nr:hypothetical protein [Thermomicrobiales bacterium]
MTTHHCRAPGCGRFVSAHGDICARHTDQTPNATLDPEIKAMRDILNDVRKDISDTETKAKLIPRIVSVTIQAIKTGHQLGSRDVSELMDLLEEVERTMETKR